MTTVETTPITSTLMPTMLLRVKQYKNARDFERDGRKMMARGWRLEGQSHQPGSLGLGGAALGAVVAGPVGVIAASGMSRKGKITVTWVKDAGADDGIDRRPFQAVLWVLLALLMLFVAIATIPTVIGAIVFGFLSLGCFVKATKAGRGE